jgi:hypothetical protein
MLGTFGTQVHAALAHDLFAVLVQNDLKTNFRADVYAHERAHRSEVRPIADCCYMSFSWKLRCWVCACASWVAALPSLFTGFAALCVLQPSTPSSFLLSDMHTLYQDWSCM